MGTILGTFWFEIEDFIELVPESEISARDLDFGKNNSTKNLIYSTRVDKYVRQFFCRALGRFWDVFIIDFEQFRMEIVDLGEIYHMGAWVFNENPFGGRKF